MRPEEDVCAEWEQKLLINLSALEGLEIISIRAQIVAPEINQVFLQANEIATKIQNPLQTVFLAFLLNFLLKFLLSALV